MQHFCFLSTDYLLFAYILAQGIPIAIRLLVDELVDGRNCNRRVLHVGNGLLALTESSQRMFFLFVAVLRYIKSNHLCTKKDLV